MFPTQYDEILTVLRAIDPAQYDRSRNFLDGAVTRLSPYLTHGALTLPEVRDAAYGKAGKRDSYRLVFELAWREYFQQVWWERGEGIFKDIKRSQEPVRERNGVPMAIIEAATGIDAIDASIDELYETGYVHNHARMWTAMLTTNIAQTHWKPAAEWYYYHLLDGDLASNTLSWQWVAGTFASKKYFANQENINKYDRVNRQYGTFLDATYEELSELPVPEALRATRMPELPCSLPEGDTVQVPAGATVLLYHPWSLHPKWREGEKAIRVLVLEPSHFARFPVSPTRIEFILGLAANIPDLQVFVGEAKAIPGIAEAAEVVSLAHPATRHFPGRKDAPHWLFPQWPGNRAMPGSFMGYWKDAERWL